MSKNESLNELTNALKCLPGVGPKSALRLSLLFTPKRTVKGAQNLAQSIDKALNKVSSL